MRQGRGEIDGGDSSDGEQRKGELNVEDHNQLETHPDYGEK